MKPSEGLLRAGEDNVRLTDALVAEKARGDEAVALLREMQSARHIGMLGRILATWSNVRVFLAREEAR